MDLEKWRTLGECLGEYLPQFQREVMRVPPSYCPALEYLPGMVRTDQQRRGIASSSTMTLFQQAVFSAHRAWRTMGKDLGSFLNVEALPENLQDSFRLIDTCIAEAMTHRPFDKAALNAAEDRILNARLTELPLRIEGQDIRLKASSGLNINFLFLDLARLHVTSQISAGEWLQGNLSQLRRTGDEAARITVRVAEELIDHGPATVESAIAQLLDPREHAMTLEIQKAAHELRVAHAATHGPESAYSGLLEFAELDTHLDSNLTLEEIVLLGKVISVWTDHEIDELRNSPNDLIAHLRHRVAENNHPSLQDREVMTSLREALERLPRGASLPIAVATHAR